MFYIIVAATKLFLEKDAFRFPLEDTVADLKPIPGRSLVLREISLLKLCILDYGALNAASW